MSKECTTHHYACDCREEKFKQLERENAALRSDLSKCNNLSEIRRDAFYDEKSARWAMVDRMRELERENAALKQRILDDNKAYGCELMDPSGTIWDHAKRLQQENAELREDKERLDWLNIHMECHCHDEDGFHSWLWVKAPATNKDLRAAIDAARKEAQP